MRFRAATLNLEQDHKRWDARRELVLEQLAALRPDVMALNEVCVPLQTARPSAALMATRFRPTQTAPTAFTPLSDSNGEVSHSGRARMDRCIDFVWVSSAVRACESGVCFNQPSAGDASLWPSDHAGVWADLEVG